MEAMLNSRLGRTILGATHVTIGCTSDNQMVLSETGVESRHAEIRPEGQGYSILDLGSSAGTFVNGQRLVPHIPQLLQNGDTIRIGNTSLSYEITSGPSIAPTVYAASPGQVSDLGLGYSPTVMAPGGAAASYGALGQSGDALYAPPPLVSPGYNLDDPYGSATPKKRGRRGLWITLGAVVGVLVIGVVLFVVVAARGPSTTPTQTYQAYCAALKAHNGQAAFNLYSSNAKQQLQLTEEKIATIANATTDCTVSNVDDTTAAGSVTLTLTSVGKITEDDKLTSSEGNIWKIDAQQPRSTPTYTLFRFCSDLVQGDYHAAYGLYTSAYQSKTTESDYANGFSSGKPTDCTLSNVDDATGKGVVTLTFSAGSGSYDETLTNENGAWKINNEQVHSTPTVTLNTYCNALKQQDYQTAYNQLSSDNQSRTKEADFANGFSADKVTDCSVSNVDDNAGTGTISYTLADGKTGTADYTLVQENGIWKLKTEKFR
jgi:limonene-1,2-epoxide hydrolase